MVFQSQGLSIFMQAVHTDEHFYRNIFHIKSQDITYGKNRVQV